MSNFTPLVDHEFEFQGDTVKVRYARLKRTEMLKVLPLFKKLAESEDQQDGVNEILELLIDSIPEYVKEFSGLLDANGNPVTIDVVIADFYFLQLAAQIAMQMIKDSSPQGEA
jgi:hypothetical protein